MNKIKLKSFIYGHWKKSPLEILAILIQIIIAIFLIWYTIETYQIRVLTQNREQIELRGYFGIDTEQLPHINKNRIFLNFKNFGKTPIKIIDQKSLIEDSNGISSPENELTIVQGFLNPSATHRQILIFKENADIGRYKLHLSFIYETAYKNKEEYKITLNFDNKIFYYEKEEIRKLN